MPLKLNVGLSRKVGEANYGSRGASVNVETELDSGVVQEPDKLKERIRQLFGLARSSLDEELNGKLINGRSQTNGSNGSHNQGEKPARRATKSQVNALFAITRAQDLNLEAILRKQFQVTEPEQLTITEASQLISELKGSQRGAA